ncbi:hypothetical protein Tco_1532678 [Tanacetum coccineum]
MGGRSTLYCQREELVLLVLPVVCLYRQWQLILLALSLKVSAAAYDCFGALCYPTNDSEDLGKLQLKADIGIFIGYSLSKNAYRIFTKRTRMIMETIYVHFDELTKMASEQYSSGPELQPLTSGHISSGLVPNPVVSTSAKPPLKKDWDVLFQPMFDEYFKPPISALSPTISAATLPTQDICWD